MAPRACIARGFHEFEPIHRAGFCYLNYRQGGQRGAQGMLGPHFLISNLSLPGCVGDVSPHGSSERPIWRPGPAAASAGMPRLVLSPDQSFSTVWGRVTNRPRAQIWILLLFSPFCMGDRERRRRREKPLKNVSCSIAQQFTSPLSPVTLPWCTS